MFLEGQLKPVFEYLGLTLKNRLKWKKISMIEREDGGKLC